MGHQFLQLFKWKRFSFKDHRPNPLHLKSKRCEHLPTPLICKNKPHPWHPSDTKRYWHFTQTSLLTSAGEKRLQVSVLLWTFWTSGVFLRHWRFLCLLLCVRLIVASLHCWCCSARKTHPLRLLLWLSPPPIGCRVEAVTSPFFPSCSVPSFSDHFFIVSILFSALHSLGAKRKMTVISFVIGRICLKQRGESVMQRSDDMLNAESSSTAPLKRFCGWFGGRK